MATEIKNFSFFDYLNFRGYVHDYTDRGCLLYKPVGFRSGKILCNPLSDGTILISSCYFSISNKLSHKDVVKLGTLLQSEFNAITNNKENVVSFIICEEHNSRYTVSAAYIVPTHAEYFIYSNMVSEITQKLVDYLKNMCVQHKPLFNDNTLALYIPD